MLKLPIAIYLMLALHFIVAAMLGGGALFSRYHDMLPEKARA
jgi:hypothetical protein